jgi:hypothetical protein
MKAADAYPGYSFAEAFRFGGIVARCLAVAVCWRSQVERDVVAVCCARKWVGGRVTRFRTVTVWWSWAWVDLECAECRYLGVVLGFFRLPWRGKARVPCVRAVLLPLLTRPRCGRLAHQAGSILLAGSAWGGRAASAFFAYPPPRAPALRPARLSKCGRVFWCAGRQLRGLG